MAADEPKPRIDREALAKQADFVDGLEIAIAEFEDAGGEADEPVTVTITITGHITGKSGNNSVDMVPPHTVDDGGEPTNGDH